MYQCKSKWQMVLLLDELQRARGSDHAARGCHPSEGAADHSSHPHAL
jgi:hypothetical protein